MSWKKLLILLCFGIFTFSLFVPKTFAAVSLSVNNIPTTINDFQDFSIDVSLTCSGCGDSYLRAVFYPSGTSYFGYTQDNNNNWVNAPAANCATFYKVAQADLVSGNWSGVLKIKVDTQSPYYTGPGEYLFKVGRYTSSCGSPTWSSETSIEIFGPTPTPTVTPTPTKEPTPTKAPTETPTPKIPTSTKTPTLSASLAAKIGRGISVGPTRKVTMVLGVSRVASSSPTIKGSPTKKAAHPTTGQVKTLAASNSPLPKLIITTGVLLLIMCGILFYLHWRRTHDTQNE